MGTVTRNKGERYSLCVCCMLGVGLGISTPAFRSRIKSLKAICFNKIAFSPWILHLQLENMLVQCIYTLALLPCTQESYFQEFLLKKSSKIPTKRYVVWSLIQRSLLQQETKNKWKTQARLSFPWKANGQSINFGKSVSWDVRRPLETMVSSIQRDTIQCYDTLI